MTEVEFSLVILPLLVGMIVISIIMYYLREHNSDDNHNAWWLSHYVPTWLRNWLADFSTELVGILLTTLLFGIILLLIQSHTERINRREDLIIQMGLPDNGMALHAARQLQLEGWLADGSLVGRNFAGADLRDLNRNQWFADWSGSEEVLNTEVNLANANLYEVCLRNADLRGANLQGANLLFADLTGADLSGANLREANLNVTNLTDTILMGADLTYTEITQSVLVGADLTNAIITGTDFGMSQLEGATMVDLAGSPDILPDFYENYTPVEGEIDWLRYTDPNHPDYYPGGYTVTDCGD